jgi:hypothetical protein
MKTLKVILYSGENIQLLADSLMEEIAAIDPEIWRVLDKEDIQTKFRLYLKNSLKF